MTFFFFFFGGVCIYCIGRIWAGHNIRSFDCVRIREAFEEIGKPAPEPKDTLDTFQLLRRSFGHRAGNMQVSIG